MTRYRIQPIYGPNGDILSRKLVETPWTTGGGEWTAGQSWLQWISTPWYRKDPGEVVDPFSQHAWYRAILERKADALASVPPAIFTGARGDKSPDMIDPAYDRWARLFDAPNPECSWREFITVHLYHRRLYGAALWLTTRDGIPAKIEDATELYLLHPMGFVPKRSGGTNRITSWVPVTTNTEANAYPAESVHAFRVPNPYGGDQLCAPWKSANVSLNVDLVWEDANLEFGKRGFSLGGWIIGKDWDKHQVEDVRKTLNDRYSGSGHAGEYAVLGGGSDISVVPNQANHKNMEFVEIGRFNLEKLLALEGIPLSWVSQGNKLNNSTLEGEDAGTWLRTINPELVEIENYWWRNLFSKVDSGRRWLQFDRSQVPAFVSAMYATKLSLAKNLAELGYPINAINDALGLGMPRVEWGDEAYVNGAMLPLSFVAESEQHFEDAQETNQAPANSESNDAPKAPRGARAENDDRVSRDQMWRGYVREVLDPNEARFREMVVGYFGLQRREVLERFDAATKGMRASEGARVQLTEEEIDRILFEMERWNRKLVSRANPIYRQIATTATQHLAQELGGLDAWSAENPAVTALMESRGAALVQVNETTREALRKTLVDGSAANETVLELATRINQVYNIGGRSRSLVIARTETASMANAVRFEGMKAEGIVEQEWVTARDEAVRESHQSLDGQKRAIGETFGNGLEYPGDPAGDAGEVVNCRCVAVPVVKEIAP